MKAAMPAPATARLVFWETTVACNLACRHCRRLDVAAALAAHDLTTEQVTHHLLDELVAMGRPILVCSGGEPLLRHDLFDLARRAGERGLTLALATNGTLIDDPMADRIADAPFEQVSISLDGADAGTHDAFRQQPGAFDAAIAGVSRLRARGVAGQINTTVTQHNVQQLPALYEQVLALGVKAWHVFMFVPVGCGLEIPERQHLLAAQYETVLRWLAERAQDRRLFVRATCAPQYYRILAQAHVLQQFRMASKFSTMTKGCLAGAGIGFISHTGEVFPCGYLPVSAGNITRTPLATIWATAPVFQALRDPAALTGKCGGCEFKSLCSGCRARAYAASGDYLAEEPCCPYMPRTQQVEEAGVP